MGRKEDVINFGNWVAIAFAYIYNSDIAFETMTEYVDNGIYYYYKIEMGYRDMRYMDKQ